MDPLSIDDMQDLLPLSPPEKTKEEILLFFKLYDPLKEELRYVCILSSLKIEITFDYLCFFSFFEIRYVGKLFVKATGMPVELLTKLNEMAGFSPDEKIELFEASRMDSVTVVIVL